MGSCDYINASFIDVSALIVVIISVKLLTSCRGMEEERMHILQHKVKVNPKLQHTLLDVPFNT